MFIRKLILFLAMLKACFVFSQEETVPFRLLVYVDSTGDKEFMIPFIETSLKDMVFASNREKKLFSEVKNLNEFLATIKTERIVFQLYAFLETGSNDLSQSNKDRQDRDAATSRVLKQFNRFLKIGIRRFDQLLEYQFVMYEVVSGGDVLPVLNEHLSSSTFVDPRSPACKSDLLFALKQVCVESNQSPELRFVTNAVKWEGNYFAALGDTLRIEARVRDVDSPSERMTVHWQQEINLTGTASSFLKLKPYEFAQAVVPPDTGYYVLVAWSSDGISRSEADTFRVHVENRPVIRLRRFEYFGLPSPPSPLFQRQVFGDSSQLYMNRYYTLVSSPVFTRHSRIAIWPADVRYPLVDSLANREFIIYFGKTESKLVHKPSGNRAGVYTYNVQMGENGLHSNIEKMVLRYRNAWPCYFFAGVQSAHARKLKVTDGYFSSGMVLYFNRNTRIEYAADLPLVTSAAYDSLPGGGKAVNHHFRILLPLAALMNLSQRWDQVDIDAECGAGIYHYPFYTANAYPALDFGASLRLRYIANVLGTIFRFNYILLGETGVANVPRGFGIMTVALSFQPVTGGR